MNILVLNWRDPKNPKAGGAEFVTMKHARSWVAAGHTVTWFTSSFPGARRHETIEGVQFVRWGGERSVILLAPSFYISRHKEFDIVVDEIHGLPFFTPLFVRKPIIAFIHEVAAEIWNTMYPFPINVFGRIIEPIFFPLYRRVPFWTDAQATIGDLQSHGIKATQCHAIPCPIANIPVPRLPKKEALPTFLFVSRIVKMKGIEDVIRAFSFIAQALPSARLWVVGIGEQRYVDDVRRRIESLALVPRVRFFGYVSEESKLSLMRRAHILLHASVKEGWGLVVLEAASQGTPAVVYNVPGLSEVVKHGRTGIVVSANTPRTMADAATSLYHNRDQYTSFQRRGIAWAKSLRWEDVTKQSLALLLETYEKQKLSCH